MYDSVEATAIPADAAIVAGYVDGIYKWSQAAWDRFPNAIKVRISAVGSTHNAHVFDVEDGCIWPPANVVPLVVAARAAGIDPTVYVNELNDWDPTRREFDKAGVDHPHWWVANYDGRETIPNGAVGKQYAHPPMIGKHYDLSVVADYWPGVDASEGDDFLMGLQQWQQERMFDRILKMSAGVRGENFDGAQFEHENGQRLAIMNALQAQNEVLLQLAGKASNITLTDAQLEALKSNLNAAIAKEIDESEATLAAHLDAMSSMLVERLGTNRDETMSVLEEFYSRAVSTPKEGS
jgi:hypothetical protein